MQYQRIQTPPTLRSRIEETQRRATVAAEQSRRSPTRPAQASFAEQYRGTEHETGAVALPARQSTTSRGRSLVLLSASAVVATIAVIVASTTT